MAWACKKLPGRQVKFNDAQRKLEKAEAVFKDKGEVWLCPREHLCVNHYYHSARR
jgi:hypothetical protein